MTRWKKNTTFRLVPFLISCWLSNSKEPLNVSFSLKNRSKTFHQQRKMKIFHISFYYYFVSRGRGEGRKRKSHLLYTHTHPSSLPQPITQLSNIYKNLSLFQFILPRKVLNSPGAMDDGGRKAEDGRMRTIASFNSKTKGVKVIFHNFPPRFLLCRHHTQHYDDV